MKNALIIILLFVFAYPCFAELTENDVRLIRQIIREEIEPLKIEMAKEFEAVKVEMATIKGDIKVLESKMATKDDIIAMRGSLSGRMASLEGRMATKDDIIALYGLLVGILIAIVVAILSIFINPFLKIWLERREPKRNLPPVVRPGGEKFNTTTHP